MLNSRKIQLKSFCFILVAFLFCCYSNGQQKVDSLEIEFINFNDSEYAFVRHKKSNLKVAACECDKLNMELIKIESASENEFITNQAFKKDGIKGKDGNQYWIGATDAKEEGDWIWLVDSLLFFNQREFKPINNSYTNWGKTKIGQQPNNVFKNEEYENCVVIRKGGAWYDIGCEKRFAYVICERKIR